LGFVERFVVKEIFLLTAKHGKESLNSFHCEQEFLVGQKMIEKSYSRKHGIFISLSLLFQQSSLP